MKLFFDPNPLVNVLPAGRDQPPLRADHQPGTGQSRRLERPLLRGAAQPGPIETTRSSIELKNLKMRVEALWAPRLLRTTRARAGGRGAGYRPEAVAPREGRADPSEAAAGSVGPAGVAGPSGSVGSGGAGGTPTAGGGGGAVAAAAVPGSAARPERDGRRPGRYAGSDDGDGGDEGGDGGDDRPASGEATAATPAQAPTAAPPPPDADPLASVDRGRRSTLRRRNQRRRRAACPLCRRAPGTTRRGRGADHVRPRLHLVGQRLPRGREPRGRGRHPPLPGVTDPFAARLRRLVEAGVRVDALGERRAGVAGRRRADQPGAHRSSRH